MGGRCARAVIVACLMLPWCLAALDGLDGGGMARGRPTLLGGEFAGGSGTASDPYLITNVYELQNMSKDLGAHYVLASDIDASATASWNGGAGFVPVGTSSNRFTGSIDGRNHTISGIYINRSGINYVGLFGYIAKGTVKDATLINNYVTGERHVGGLVGYFSSGMVSNCYAAGNVAGNMDVGGLVGHSYEDIVSDCYATGNVNGSESVGGLVGYSFRDTVSNCCATGNVTGSEHVGGLVGYSYEGTVSNCYSTGSATGSERVGGLVGRDERCTVSNSHYNIDGTLINGGHYVTLGGLFDEQYKDWMDNGMTLDIDDYSSTLTSNGSHYDIAGIQGMRDLLGFADGADLRFRLISDIDLSDSPGLHIPRFAAREFDGNGHVIRNFKLDQTFTRNLGLFGHMNGSGAIQKLGILDCSVTGGDCVSGLVGYISTGTVSNCFMTGNVTGREYIGGFMGYSGTNGTVSNCYATGNATGWYSVGGLVGKLGLSSTVSNCYATGTVNGSEYLGGLVGSSDGWVVISNSFWDVQSSGIGTSAGGTGKSTAEMRTRSTFTNAGWDFNGVWCINENVTYPLLWWQDARPPTARAGPDQMVDEGTLVIFDGGGSTDNVGIANWTWTFTDGIPVTLFGTQPSYRFDNYGVFVVVLNITDATGHWATDSLTVSVRDVTPPEADAGPDQTVDEGTMVTLDGIGSTDNVEVVYLTWTFTDGAIVILHGVRPTYPFDNPGTFAVVVNVTDAAGNWHTDSMTVIVRDKTPPVSDAGQDRRVPVGTPVTLDGTLSSDNVGISTYKWAVTYDGQACTFRGATVQFIFEIIGAYEVVLTIYDAAGNAGEDTVVITVVGTGTVTGIVLDNGGRPVEGATVVVTTAEGRTYNVTTAANGTFSLDVPHGAFYWKISKKGYKALSGSGSVGPMDATELDLSGKPLVKEEGKSPGAGAAMAVAAVAVACQAAQLFTEGVRSRGRSHRPPSREP